MRLLADENVHAALVQWLRAGGHDVRYVSEDCPSLADRDVLEWAMRESRILLTDDKDFGDLAVRHQISAKGIILVRLTARSIVDRINRLQQAWPTIEANAEASLIVIADDRIRVRPLLHH